MEVVKGSLLLLVISWKQVVTWEKGSGLLRRHVPGDTFYGIPDQGHPTPRRRNRLRPPSSEGVVSEVGVPRNLFPRLGVG